MEDTNNSGEAVFDAAQNDSGAEKTTEVVVDKHEEGEVVDVKPTESWIDGLADEGLRGNPNIKKFGSVDALAKGYVEAVKMLGKKGFEPLPKDATPEMAEARRAIRRGENIKTTDDYSWKMSEEDKNFLYPGQSEKGLADALFKSGADDQQFGEVMDAWVESVREQAVARASALQKCDEQLRDEWNEDYDVNMKANELFVSRRFPEVHEELVRMGGYHVPAIAKMFKQLSELAADGEIRVQKAAAMTFDEELKKIEESDAYRNPWSNGHNEAVNRRTDIIMKMAQKGVRQ